MNGQRKRVIAALALVGLVVLGVIVVQEKALANDFNGAFVILTLIVVAVVCAVGSGKE